MGLEGQIGTYAALKFPDFRLYLLQRFLAILSHLMLTVALGQYVYEVTHSPFHLGYIGLSLFLPKIGFALLAGHTADRFDRRHVILVCRVIQFLVVIGMISVSLRPSSPISLLYLLLFLLGTANAFDGPASQSIVPQLVPQEQFSRAVTWNTSVFQVGLILGPALGGWLYSLSGRVSIVLIIIALFRFVATLLVQRLKTRTGRMETSDLSWGLLLGGLRYIFKKRIILGAISLDLFAVLLGGAVALMPIYANDILKVGPSGLGILRAAPALGATLTGLALVYLPPMKKAGRILLSAVALFGTGTILFGISHNFLFSILCLVFLGAADMISVVIRAVLVQMQTPPTMRGRVSAVNIVFIGASNELGEFESGVTAGWFGVVPAVVIGGIGTLLVVALWTRLFPEIRHYNKLDGTIEKGSLVH